MNKKAKSILMMLVVTLAIVSFCMLSFYVFVLAADNGAPVIHSLYPPNNTNTDMHHQSFDWNITDDVQIKNLTRYL